MDNFIEFMRMFLSYLVCFFTFCAVAGIGIFIGIKTKKAKDAKEAAVVSAETSDTAETNA
ncbi:MAG: vanadium nitrogenase [Lachnospiraceae bacterium]|nr:vanadium nitrogenase [Candidatus Merdinaster equi]